MFRSILIAGFALALSACGAVDTSSTGTATTAQQIAAGCATTSAALKTIAVASVAGKVTPEQHAKIRTAAQLVAPICTAPEPPTLDTVKFAAFTQAIALLTAHAAQLERTP